MYSKVYSLKVIMAETPFLVFLENFFGILISIFIWEPFIELQVLGAFTVFDSFRLSPLQFVLILVLH